MKTFVINAMTNKSKIIPRGREIDEEWGKNVSMLHRVIPTLRVNPENKSYAVF